MTKLDILILLIIALGAFTGYRRGFLMELFFLVAIISGVLIGFRLMGAGVDFLHREFNADTRYLPYLSFTIIFVLVIVGVSLIGRSLKELVDATFLGRLDSAAGALLGSAKYLFCVSVVIWLGSSLHMRVPMDWTDGSLLYSFTEGFAPGVANWVGGFLPFFKEIFHQF